MASNLLEQPWGLARMTERLPEVPPLYQTARLDPATQITHFYDASGAVVVMGKDTFVTVTMSKGGGGDGSSGSAQVADDSQTDAK
jgi:putative ATP-grasp target RiPP